MSYNIYVCGVGGQGIIKTSVIIGEAAMNEGMNVVMSEIHGMAQRGGAVSTEIRFGDVRGSIIPQGEADLVIAFEPLEALRALPKMSEDACVIVNTSKIPPFNLINSPHPYPPLEEIIKTLKENAGNVRSFNGEKIAVEAGHILSLNMVMLGAAAATRGFPLGKETLIESMRNNLPPKLMEVNMRAFHEGFGAVSCE
ncbi:indolepyruvate oxidoreductase subunit beta [Methanothermobacter sp. K4]|uniref:indolepyruvate oxidoreductase subunit beta n=1 Tax=Methanothermobacter sp. K4 TaxID=2913262 RepID=UPI001EDB61CE|nr:indolepyruvate oxidoreductase subunit beta [Methanothermobacter sp. K4]MCG2829343.1 indolepyruvate oxidoreductase subunit beta [Methanothermobacter sp. K4]